MGEMAEDMIDGTACQLCGQYFQDPKNENLAYTHGYPVICDDCWHELLEDEREGYQRAIVKTF